MPPILSGIRRQPKTALAAAALVAVLAFAWSSPSALACPYAGLRPSSITIEEAEVSVICLVNKKRHNRGMRLLRRDPRLQLAARATRWRWTPATSSPTGATEPRSTA